MAESTSTQNEPEKDKLKTSMAHTAGLRGEDDKSNGSGEGSKPAPEIDALKAHNQELEKKLDGLMKAEEARRAKKLEEDGKYKELIAQLKTEKEQLETKVSLAVRKDSLRELVAASDCKLDKSAVIKIALWLDKDGNHKADLGEVIEKAIKEAEALGAGTEKETQAFGATGSAMGRNHPEKEKIDELIALGKKYQTSGKREDRNLYMDFKAKLIEQGVAIPSNLAAKLSS